jgi:tRNA A37 threonylcarbamoyladenosine modification protein TsaB
MNKLKSILTIAAIAVSTLPLMAQQKRVSPHETVSAVIDGNRVTVVYGRPYTKDPKSSEARKIWGGLVPYGKVWRTGADEATTLTTQKPIVFGDTTIPAGAYTLYTLPQEDGSAKLIINKQLGQWGTQYDEKQDLARIDLKKDALEKPLDQLAIAVAKNPSGGGVLKIMWEDTQYSASFTVQK